MALDYIPIQASAVPCERAFSSCAETDTKRRNRLSPIMIEVLQMLKYAFNHETLDFMTGWITPKSELTSEGELAVNPSTSLRPTDHRPRTNVMDALIRAVALAEGDKASEEEEDDA